ncbi:3-phosphoshikimate 1-carboxyvinyltransferase [Lentisphaera marina]|uniref:3-phosphoshikimate 1-carboxyvinyltransferase n=1 Tax=Lentisphaera marina TaxID=1111041 RepID=UPI0023657737|nr:3-phosphoshikimate 1-carboxyvinyltransferase [Lentisphaera marina]MDD7985910.1 3-phosphoshikimate 1-carboxyvinyltransferase [Lentisphaera marina]
MEKITLPKISSIQGTVKLPGSKSISNRSLLLAALGEGKITLENILSSNDVDRMFEALQTLNIPCSRDLEELTVELQGCAGSLPDGDFNLYLENAGTAVRSMTAAICASKGNYVIDGNARMRERPISDLVEALQKLDIDISYEFNTKCPPLNIKANGIKGGLTSVNGSVSSQYITALLLASPLAENDVTINIDGDLTSKPYVDMTIGLMNKFGVEVTNDNYQTFTVPAPQKYINPSKFIVEGDAGSASYFLGAAAINGSVRVYGCGKDSIQGESGFAGVMGQMGADVTYGDNFIEVSSTGKLKGIDIDMNTMTDTGMTLAVVAMFAEGTTTIRNIANWQVKETERITAVATELKRAGATVEEGPDYLVINPPEKILNCEIETYDDHRMAMAFAILSLGTEITILDPLCCKKTFPNYFNVREGLVQK